MSSGQEAVKGEQISHDKVETYTDPSAAPSNDKACIIDAMAVVHIIKKGANRCTCSDFATAFLQKIKIMLKPYTEGRVIFDRYIEGST